MSTLLLMMLEMGRESVSAQVLIEVVYEWSFSLCMVLLAFGGAELQ